MHLKSLTLSIAAAVAAAVSFPNVAAAQAAAPAGATVSVVSHGLDVAGMDRDVKPGDDFYRFANGKWLATTEIPADRSSWTSFAILTEKANARTADIIRDASKSTSPEAKKVADYYAAFMDEKTIEERGMQPVTAELTQIYALADRSALARFLGSQMRADVDPLNNTEFHTSRVFGLWVSPDFANPSVNVAYILQGGLGMPDRDNYALADEKSRALQQKYRDHIAAVLTLAGDTNAKARAASIYAFEEKIAAAHASRTDSSEVQRAQRWRIAEFQENAPGFDWKQFFAGAGLADQQVAYAWQPHAVRGIAAIAAWEPLQTWKDYLAFHAIDRASPTLSKAFADEYFNFHGSAMTGATAQKERWKRGVEATNEALGMAVGRMYVERYFPPEAKDAAQKMVKQIVKAFGARVDRLAWMSPATKAKAKAKLGTLVVGIGYPDKWTDYSSLTVARDDAYGNAQRAELFAYRQSLAKLGKPVDKSEWWLTPQTVNAVNLPLQNALNFPAAILDTPFFDAKTDPAQNFGGIGTVIGHEISHSFDDQGALFDAQGRLANWWTDEDLEHFNAAAARLAAQYDAYEPLPGLHVNGKLTLGENIADVAGVAAAYDGYRSLYGGKEGPTVQGLKGDERFFLSFGQIWRAKRREQSLRNSLITDGHAPGAFRALTVRNIDAWYKVFDVKPQDKLYLAPKDRVRIW